MDEIGEPLGASKQNDVETERLSAPEVANEWAKQDGEYGALLRIAEAVDEARREIDLQTLQDLIDPKHKMTGADWVSFWEDRGFSDNSEASDVWMRAFADRAAKVLQKARGQL
jgi:hypothetical protein